MPEPTYRIAQRLHERRAAKGLETYGRALDANSRGCMLVHALEESADKTNYLIAEVQRRRKLLLDLAEWTSDLDGVEGAEVVRAEMLLTYLDLGGEAALAKYDEILGGAEDATVAPEPRDEKLRLATEFDFGPLPSEPEHWTNRVLVQRREGYMLPKQPYMWAVKWNGNNLSKSGEWEYEPLPSSRNDEFYARCRFDTFEEAAAAALAAIRGAR